MTEEVESSLLVIVLDTNPGQRFLQEQAHMLAQCLESVIAFADSHLMLKSSNRLAVLACHMTSTEYLFPLPGDSDAETVATLRQQDGQYEMFSHVEKTLRQNLQRLVLREVEDIRSGSVALAGDSLLAGALSMALCYIHRIERELGTGGKMNSRVLVVTGSGDSASQYMGYMNVFFTAQKQV
uniref:General transcription factor IIH subunit 3 n=1 Tax=Timema tahoe TaxID=61484 RepID=A0A7R9P1A5_9NEOP|nr:unnamed protein product [Timema tahoe]